MNKEYAEKVEVLLRLLPIVMDEKVFAVHGGSAINLFVRDLPRYSVDIDLTYIPLEGREESLEHINNHLMSIVDKAKRAFHGMHIVPKLNTSKLLCEYQGKQVKVEVNQTKRGIIGGNVQMLPLCKKAQDEFGMYCEAEIVPMTLLYGGKIAAALSRQHPRDLFDVKYMEYPLAETRKGLLFCLLGSDRPLHIRRIRADSRPTHPRRFRPDDRGRQILPRQFRTRRARLGQLRLQLFQGLPFCPMETTESPTS